MNDPTSDDSLQRLAEATRLHHAGRLDAAEEVYAALLKSTPNDPIALINAGLLAVARSDPALAIERLQRAISIVPANVVALA
ncbi:MAG TPA: hypothetical protein VMV45_02770, partial [Casimicrobiaceae bacterium]|nr:hypothetical protein [Casimicrobiaceae bacterium]